MNKVIEANDHPIPNHVSIDRTSPNYWSYYKKVGVKLNGVVIFNCVEFNVKEGWCRRTLYDNKGRLKMERGKSVAVRYQGTIETYWRGREL